MLWLEVALFSARIWQLGCLGWWVSVWEEQVYWGGKAGLKGELVISSNQESGIWRRKKEKGGQQFLVLLFIFVAS